MRILHVEQNSGINRDLALFFRSKGVIADPVETAEDALELARHYDYDLILADISLPDMDGIEFARRLRLATSSFASCARSWRAQVPKA